MQWDSAALKRQTAEFQTLAELIDAYRALPPVVDDDYPEQRHKYEAKMHVFIEALRMNRPHAFTVGAGVLSPSTVEEALQNYSTADLLTVALYRVAQLNYSRALRWHEKEAPWSVLEWAGAMCGEAGEAANVAKKIKRVLSGVASIKSGGLTSDDLADLDKKLGKECADTFLYLLLLANSRRVDLGYAIVEVFNTKSQEYGFPEIL